MNIEFLKSRPVMEFCGAVTVYGICTDEKEKKVREFIKNDELLANVLTSFNEKMSRFNKAEYAYFNQIYLLEVCMEAFIFDNPDIKSVDDYFKTLKNCESLQLFKYIVGCVWNENELDGKEFDEHADSLDELKKIVIKRADKIDKISDDLIEMITYPEETRTRILNLLKSMYSIYSQYEDKILIYTKSLREKWDLEIADDKNQIIKEIDDRHIKDSLIKMSDIFIYINYCFSFVYQFKIYDNNTAFINIGYRKREFIMSNDLDMELFYKAISDETRRRMIHEFSIRSCYLRELALKLNVKASTINHHMQILNELGLVRITSEENGLRQYYQLDQKKIDEYLERMKTELFCDYRK